MDSIDPSLWTVLNIVGMILLVAGALTVMLVVHPETFVSALYMAVGIVLIVVSSILTSLDGRKLRKEDEEYRRFERIRDQARLVPDDLREGYMIDYSTEDPDNGISYRSNEPEQHNEENFEECADEDVLIIHSN